MEKLVPRGESNRGKSISMNTRNLIITVELEESGKEKAMGSYVLLTIGDINRRVIT